MTAPRRRVRLKRVYDAPAPNDGFRILVDLLWPRGLSKPAARVDLWMKDAAPSTQLRPWCHTDLARWPGFRVRYRAELADPDNPALAALARGPLQVAARTRPLTCSRDSGWSAG